MVIECEANGFLKQQIRKANGILLEIGKGKQPAELMRQTLEGDGQRTGHSSPASAGPVLNGSKIPGRDV